MSGESAFQTSSNTEPDQTMGDPMVKKILNHKQKLEEIRKNLHVSLLRSVLGTTIENTFIPDILSIITDLEQIEKTADLFTHIPNPDFLLSKLNEIILVLDDALDAWEKISQADNLDDELKAKSIYRKHLNTCYGLLEQALRFFNPIEPTQQGTGTGGNAESIRKIP